MRLSSIQNICLIGAVLMLVAIIPSSKAATSTTNAHLLRGGSSSTAANNYATTSNIHHAAADASFASIIGKNNNHKERFNRLHRQDQLLVPSGDTPPKVPPSRQCGQVISLATIDQMKIVASAIVTLLLGDADPAAAAFVITTIQGIIQYDVHAQVVCSSCSEVAELYSANDIVNQDEGRHHFMFYCGPNRFGANATYSSLLLTPYDSETGKPVEGIVKSHVFMKSYSGRDQHAPSEYHVGDFDAWNTTDAEVIIALYSDFYDGWTSLFTAATGVVVVAPDYLGYGQSFESPKGSGIFDLYQQAASVAFLKSKIIVEGSASGCTEMGTDTSASGYSEGGAGVIAASLAVQGLGQDILNVDTGGSPWKPSFQFAFAVDTIDKGIDFENGEAEATVRDQFALLASAFSSKSPDLVNTNTGQDMLNDEWRDFIVSLSNTNTGHLGVVNFLPDPATDVINPDFLEKVRDLLAQNITDACFTSIEGVDDLLCQAIRDNSYIDIVEATTFPISICHSKNDQTIPYAHAPVDFSVNPLLSELTLLGESPTTGHLESSVFCHTAFIFQFTDFFGSAPTSLKGIKSLSDPSTCQAIAPTTAAPIVIGMESAAPATATPIVSATAAPVTVAPVVSTTTAPVTASPVATAPVASTTAAPVTAAPAPTVPPTRTQAPATLQPTSNAGSFRCDTGHYLGTIAITVWICALLG